MSLSAEELDRFEQIRLLELLERVAQELGKIRRGDRKAATVGIRMKSERPGFAWCEDTKTEVLSRYGATLRCAHQMKRGEVLTIQRLDGERTMRARVVWQKRIRGSGAVTAIEILGRSNFWA